MCVCICASEENRLKIIWKSYYDTGTCVVVDIILIREYWMIYRGPGLLAVEWFGSSFTPLPPLPSVSSTVAHTKAKKERQLARRERGGGGGGGANSYDRKKAWSSIIHSVIYESHPPTGLPVPKNKIKTMASMLLMDPYLRTFIRIHWYTVPPTFQFTVWEDGFDYIVFFSSNGNIRYDTTFYAWDIGRQFTLFHFLLQWMVP